MTVRLDLGALVHSNTRPKKNVWLNHNIPADDRIVGQPDSAGGNHSHTVLHENFAAAALPDGFGFSQLIARIDAQNLVLAALDDGCH